MFLQGGSLGYHWELVVIALCTEVVQSSSFYYGKVFGWSHVFLTETLIIENWELHFFGTDPQPYLWCSVEMTVFSLQMWFYRTLGKKIVLICVTSCNIFFGLLLFLTGILIYEENKKGCEWRMERESWRFGFVNVQIIENYNSLFWVRND